MSNQDVLSVQMVRIAIQMAIQLLRVQIAPLEPIGLQAQLLICRQIVLLVLLFRVDSTQR